MLGATSFGLLAGLGPAPVPAPSGEGRSGSGHRLRAVLAVPGVPGVIGLVALVNFVDSAAAVALLRLSADHWHAGDRGFGVATAALGFGSLAAPLLRRALALRGSLRATGAGLLLAGVVPGAAAAVAPLALAGAGSTVVECVATETLQRRVPDRFRAFSLGLTDSVMVAAAAVGALVGPGLVSLVGPVPAFGTLGLLLAVAASLGRLRRPAEVEEVGPERTEGGDAGAQQGGLEPQARGHHAGRRHEQRLRTRDEPSAEPVRARPGAADDERGRVEQRGDRPEHAGHRLDHGVAAALVVRARRRSARGRPRRRRSCPNRDAAAPARRSTPRAASPGRPVRR